ncbi:MAG: hypothetical protein NVSMB19_12170 [Vulcanimicrobiaceae bacterium]
MIIAALAVLAAVVGFVVREPIERALVVRSANAITGLDVGFEHMARDGDAYVLDGVRVRTASGAALGTATRARVIVRDRALAIELERPHVDFDPARYRDADRGAAHDAFARWQAGAGTATIRVRGGTLSLGVPHAAGTTLPFEAVDGTLHVTPAAVGFDGTLAFVDGAERFTIAGSTTAAATADGRPVQHWNAAAMPLRPLGAFVDAQSPLQPLGGFAREIALEDGATLGGTLRLDGARFTLGTHALAGIHGTLALRSGGVGTRHLAGTIDGLPFEAAGEIHDLHAHYAWLRDGSRDLASLGKLATTLASEPKLRSLRIEADAPGLAYAQYAMLGEHGPVAVSVLAIDPREPTLHFDTALAENHIVSGGERTSAMGVRTHAVGGVNGDYFDIGRTYQPQGMLVRDGSLLRGPTDRAALAIRKDGSVTFAEFHLHGVARTVRATLPITEYNDWPPGHVSIITPDYGKELRPTPETTFVGLEAVGAGRKTYRVTSVEAATHAITAAFGIGIGRLEKAAPLPRVGETIVLEYRTDPPLDGATAAIGGGPMLVRGGEAYDDPHAPAPDERDYRWPVVALARGSDARLMLVAVDGRHPERSVGMTRPEFADLLIRLGTTDAMALDSGGSVTLVSRAPGDANASVRNVPSDNSAERWVSDALFIYSSAPAPTIVAPAAASTPVPEARPSP